MSLHQLTTLLESRAPAHEASARTRGTTLLALYDSNVLPLFEWHAGGRILDANDAWLQLTGSTREELAAGLLRWDDLIPGDDRQSVEQMLACLRDGTPFETPAERQYQLRDGRFLWVLTSGAALRGSRDRGVAFALDITERTRALEKLHDQEGFIRSVFASLVGHVAVIDRLGVITAVNDNWRRFAQASGGTEERTGVGANYLAVCRRAQLGGDAIAGAALEGIRAVLDGASREYSLEYACGTPRTREQWYRMQCLPLARPEGSAIVSHLDVTERRVAELESRRLSLELARFERISLAGELSASLAHELTQPLTSILSNAEACLTLLDAGMPQPETLRSMLESIVREDVRAGEVIRRLRALLGKGPPERQPIELRRLVLETFDLLRPILLPAGVQESLRVEQDIPCVFADRVQIQQALINLLLNAVEAMQCISRERRRVCVELSATADGFVCIRVIDSGPGVEPRDRERIFEAFETTKPHGMGMGLRITRSIVAAHGGTVQVEDSPGPGAVFALRLPTSVCPTSNGESWR